MLLKFIKENVRLSRHFRHVTKGCTFKNLNLRKKVDCKISHADWPEVVVIWAPFERQKIEVHIFERANLSGFGTWKFTTKENLNRQKQVFLQF